MSRVTAFAWALLFGLGLGVRVDLNQEVVGLDTETQRGEEVWEVVPPSAEYGHVVRAMRRTVIPDFNEARKNCGDLPRITEDMLPDEVKKSAARYRVLVLPPESEPLEFFLDHTGKTWTSNPHPCSVDVLEEDSNVMLSPEDELVHKSLELLRMRTEEKCGSARVFIGKQVWAAYLVGGTRDQHLELFVAGAEGPMILRKVTIEWSNEAASPADGKILASNVPLCELSGQGDPDPEYAPSISRNGSDTSLDAKAALLELRAQGRERAQETRRAKAQRQAHEAAKPLLPAYTGPLPKELDWRKKRPDCFIEGVVQDQGSCGSCWAFAAMGALSDRHCIANGAKSMTWKDGTLKRFSVQDWLSCYKTDSKTGKPDGCEGGNLDRAFPMMMTKPFAFERHSPYTARCWQKDGGDQGVVNDEESAGCEEYKHLPDDPLTDKPCKCWKQRSADYGSCKEGITRQKVQYSWGSLSAFKELSTAKREELLMRIIYDGGPVAAGFRVWEDFRELINRDSSMPYRRWRRDAKFKGGHAIVVAGWGEEQDGLPFWWIRNSWGGSWALSGYCKFLRRDNNVGIELDVAYPIVVQDAPQTLDPTKLGIRPAWKDEFMGKMNWGEIVDKKDGTFKVERDWGWKAPKIDVKFDVTKQVVKKDFYRGDKFPEGSFYLLRVSMPFSCSLPCQLSSTEKYNTTSGKTAYRQISSQIDDDSWTKGWLHLDVEADDPINKWGTAKLEVKARSPLRDQVRLRFTKQGVDWIHDVDGDWSIPDYETVHKVSFYMQEHKTAGPEPRIFPFKVAFGEFTWKWGSGTKSGPPTLRMPVEATDKATFVIKVKDSSTGKLLAQGACNQERPSRWCWPTLGDKYGAPFASSDDEILSPRGAAYGKTLLLELEGTCTDCGAPEQAKAQTTYRVPNFSERKEGSFAPFTLKISEPNKKDFKAGSGKSSWDMSTLWLSARASGDSFYQVSISDLAGKEICAGKVTTDEPSSSLFVSLGGSSSRFSDCPPNLLSPGGPTAGKLIYISVTATCVGCYTQGTATDKLLWKVPLA